MEYTAGSTKAGVEVTCMPARAKTKVPKSSRAKTQMNHIPVLPRTFIIRTRSRVGVALEWRTTFDKLASRATGEGAAEKLMADVEKYTVQ